jgi:hypothetical protein
MDQTAGNARTMLTVSMVDPEIVRQLLALRALGWGIKQLSRELGIARNSVRRYLRDGKAADTQTRPGAWTDYDRRNGPGFSAPTRSNTERAGRGSFSGVTGSGLRRIATSNGAAAMSSGAPLHRSDNPVLARAHPFSDRFSS